MNDPARRNAVWLLACLLLISRGTVPAAEQRDLILVAGQSNAVGFDAYARELPADPADKDVLFWWRCGDPPPDEHDSTCQGRWTALQPQPRGNPLARDSGEAGERAFGLGRQYGNFAKPEGGFGPELGLARALRAQVGKPLAIVKAAFSGTGLRTDWNPADRGDGGACYRALVSETRAAIAAAKAQGIALQPRALIWVQGESDANAQDAPRYEQALRAMLSALRKDLETPQLIALLGVNTHFGNDQNPFVPKIVEAQQAIAARDNCCAYVDTADAETLLPSRTHFTAAGTLEVGRRFAAALLKLEAANAKRAAEDAAIEAKYQALVAGLPPEQRAWERVLQDQLGSFYLPLHKRDKVADRSNAWDFVPDDPQLPRVLLIGDSVSRGYTEAVRKALAGKANVHRAPANCGPTASGLKNIDVWLGDGKWAVIHFNFGIHDRGTPLADYTQRLDQLIKRMQKTGAKLIWASTTPIPDDPARQQAAASIVERNRAAAEIMARHGIAVDDLFTAVTPHLAEMQNPKDVHFNAKGYEFLGQTVAAAIEQAIK